MMSKSEIYSIWANLGIAFNESPYSNVPPERAIIETLKVMDPNRDRKIYSLMFLWLGQYEHIVRFEPLYHLESELNHIQLRILGSIAKKISHNAIRWKHVVKKIHSNERLHTIKREYLTDKRRIETRGADPDFLEFKLMLDPIAESDKSKLRPWSYILKNNFWIRFRREGGTNLRSDIRAAFYYRPVNGPYRAAKLIGCLPNSVYKTWKEIAEVQEVGLIEGKIK